LITTWIRTSRETPWFHTCPFSRKKRRAWRNCKELISGGFRNVINYENNGVFSIRVRETQKRL